MSDLEPVVIELNPGFASGSIYKEGIPARQLALFKYLEKVRENPEILKEMPKGFEKEINLWEKSRAEIAGEKKYWELLGDWVK